MNRLRLVGLVAVAGMTLAGCSVSTSGLPLPFRPGVGGRTVTVQMADVANLVPNSEVKVADVTVGTVTAISFKDWTAQVTVALDDDAKLPSNATAKVGQKSALGAEYLELAPPTKVAPVGQLQAGATIPVAQTSRYPETEEVLAALSTVLNGGGLQQIKTITTELNAALDGRQGDFHDLINNLDDFVGALNKQKGDIVHAIDGISRLSTTLAAQNATLDHAVQTIPAGLSVLEQQRSQLVDSLQSLSDLGAVATRVINGSKDDLVGNLHDLQPALKKLADSGSNLTQSLSLVTTYPFPQHTVFPNVMRGDDFNFFVTVDLDPLTLAKNFGFGFGTGDATLPGIGALPPLGAGVTGGNPLSAPLKGLPIPLGQDPSGPLGGVLGGGRPRDNAPAPATPTPTPAPGIGGPVGSLIGGGQ